MAYELLLVAVLAFIGGLVLGSIRGRTESEVKDVGNFVLLKDETDHSIYPYLQSSQINLDGLKQGDIVTLKVDIRSNADKKSND